MFIALAPVLFFSSLSKDVKLVIDKFGQSQIENRNMNLSNILLEMNNTIDRFSTDVSNARPQALQNSSILIRFQNEISDLKRSIQNLEKDKNHDKAILEELIGLVKRLENDIANVRTSSKSYQVSMLQ